MTLMKEALLYASLNLLIAAGLLLASGFISRAIGLGCILLTLAVIWMLTGFAHTIKQGRLSRIRSTYSVQARESDIMLMRLVQSRQDSDYQI